jgi:hypothetical protein
VSRLREAPLASPAPTDSERQFTAQRLHPVVQRLFRELDIRGLGTAGDGGPPVAPTYLLGLQFYPDITIAHYDRRLLAIEVKILRIGQRQNALATAVGQAAIYKGLYERTCVLVVDMVGELPDDEVVSARTLLSGAALGLVVRRRDGSRLLPDLA